MGITRVPVEDIELWGGRCSLWRMSRERRWKVCLGHSFPVPCAHQWSDRPCLPDGTQPNSVQMLTQNESLCVEEQEEIARLLEQ